MRDWSLNGGQPRPSAISSLPTPGARPGLCLEPDRRPASGSRWQWAIAQVCRARSHGLGGAPCLAQQDLRGAGEDRESGGEGKSVELGGRRIIKKKKRGRE